MKPFIVLIGGGTASGKSTLSESLHACLSAYEPELIPMDRYMRRGDPDAPKIFFPYIGEETMDFNRPDSIHLGALLEDLQRSTAQVIILEGLMTLAIPELLAKGGLKVYVDLEADIRSVRRMERDIRTKRSNGDPALIAAYYITCARVGHEKYVQPSMKNADLIVRGDSDLTATADMISKLVVASCLAPTGRKQKSPDSI